jgi:bifunctional ADP-heptose synthase (sugar kinase/adenylyltransferase)
MIVYSYYCLDIIHPGHLLQMKNAKRLAGKDGISIIGVLTDEAIMEKKPRPIIPFDERMIIGEAIGYADLVVPQETYSPIPNVLKMRPDILMESASHSDELIELSRKTMRELGGIVMVTPYYPVQSSTNIKGKIKDEKNVTGGDIVA